MAMANEAKETSQPTKRSTAKVEAPSISYIDELPTEVACVINEIQKYMMEQLDHSRPKVIPSMPRQFICYKNINKKEIEKWLVLAHEDRNKCPNCYQVVVPFDVRHKGQMLTVASTPTSRFPWSGNVISFSKVSKAAEDLVVIKIKGNRKAKAKVKVSKPLRKFLESSLVVSHPTGCRLVSSHKMTISWLRSHLHRALNKYREVEKDVEVIATIKQKDGGPLFLRLHVEKSNTSGEITEHDLLLSFCPAFRVTACHFVVPAFQELDFPIQVQTKFTVTTKQCLWKIFPKCHELEDDHCQCNDYLSFIKKDLFDLNKHRTTIADEEETENTKSECIREPSEITPTQRQECEQCNSHVSRMLLEYFYQYGHIPETEMNQADLFVTEILDFIRDSIEEDRKNNDPKILGFVKRGSVAEKLKVVKPDEFDVMIKIDLPKSTQCYTFQSDDSFPPGYVVCQVKRSNTFSSDLKRCFKQSDDFGHCLAPEQLAFGWLYGKVVRAISKYEGNASPKADLKLRRRGPALLLEISPFIQSMPKLPQKISVDLVLALKLSESDGRYAVAKRATEEFFYKTVVSELQTCEEDVQLQILTDSFVEDDDENEILKAGHPEASRVWAQDKKIVNKRIELARKNLKYLWKISYSAQEKRYLEYAREIQKKSGVEGCQDICVMILKTICTREIVKREESVVYHKLSSYFLKTALFHVLANTDLIQDWRMDCLADRYVDLLDKLSNWKELPDFFFNNTYNLRKVFPKDDWCEITTPKNLLDELHATLKNQLRYRFAHIANSFKECKRRIESDAVESRKPEEVIHPPFDKSFRPDEGSGESSAAAQTRDNHIGKAAQAERKCGPRSDPNRNLQRPGEDEKKSKDYRKR